MCLGRLMQTATNLSPDTWYPGRDSNLRQQFYPLDCEARCSSNCDLLILSEDYSGEFKIFGNEFNKSEFHLQRNKERTKFSEHLSP